MRRCVVQVMLVVVGGLGPRAFGASPDWRDYISGPQKRIVKAASVESVRPGEGTVLQPEDALVEDGVAATIIRSGSPSPELAIDFGLPVSGKIEIVFGPTVDATLSVAFSQRIEFLQIGSDTTVWCLGDLTAKGRPGITWRSDARRGFRYVLLYLPEDGTVTIDAVRMYHTPFLGTPDTYDGHFLCSDDLLNRIWYGCVYTQEMCTTSAYECDGPWEIEEGLMSVSWDQKHEFGLSVPGTDWHDYALDFDLVIMPLGRACGWCFHATDENNAYVWRMVSAEGETPNTLHRSFRQNGAWSTLGSVPLPQPVHEGEPHHLRAEVEGSTIRTYLDDNLIDTTVDATFPQGRIGFRCDPGGDHFHVDNVAVTSATATLFSDGFESEFLVLDGGKWDRAELLTINDGAKRDRYWYLGDFYPVQRTMFNAHWLPEIVADTLRDAAEHQFTDAEEAQYGKLISGKIPPSNLWNYMREEDQMYLILDDFSLWWVPTLHHYWMRTGDQALLAEVYPALRRLFERWALRKQNSDDLLGLHVLDWYWSLVRWGRVTSFNALYVNALRRGAEIATELGHANDAAAWSARADAVRSAINAHLFDATNELYVDSQRDRIHHPLDANTLTILYGIADEIRAATMLDLIEEHMWSPLGTIPSWPTYDSWGHNRQVWVWYVQYEVAARFQLNDDARAFEAIRRPWGHMVNNDPGRTMWEFMMPDGTMENGIRNTDHGFSSGAAWLLSEYVAGIQPTSPGFATFDQIPHPGDLEWVECSVPSPLGPFTVEYNIGSTRKTYQATLRVPSGSAGRIAVPRLGESALVILDGETVWSPSGPTGDAYADGFHLYFPNVGPGEHHLSAYFDEAIPVPGDAPSIRVR